MGNLKSDDDDILLFHREIVELVKKYQFRDREQIVCWGISVSQCYVLETLHAEGNLTVSELADHMHLSISTITRVFDQLVKKGYAVREQDAQDKRIFLCKLTDEGTEIYKKLWEIVSESEKAVLADFSADQRKLLIEFLKKINRSAPFVENSKQT
ncbi:MAG: MarR family transcriptional regulator [Pyrinomonadaceae bacterium]